MPRSQPRCGRNRDRVMVMEAPSAVPVATVRLPVLVVDDEYGPRESIAFSLAQEFAVETAERAAEALAKLRVKSYAAVVLDIRMPEMDGIRALEELRKIDPLVSVIMLTGYGTLATAQQAMLAGANQYLRKPPDIAELITAVRNQAVATRVRRQQARADREARELAIALKQEIARHEPHIWQGRASVELVHDLNNPLTVVIGYATLLVEEARTVATRDPERGRRLLEYAGLVEKAAEYCHHLSENWRQTTRKTGELAHIDLVEVAHEVRQVVFFSSDKIVIEGLATAPVRGMKFEMMRVFQNLFQNAIEAGATRVAFVVGQAGGQLELTIEDNGAGMSPDGVKRALHGGFTTKVTGTGLGLSICRHLVGAHGATFALTSAPGKGTTVKLVFPAAPAVA